MSLLSTSSLKLDSSIPPYLQTCIMKYATVKEDLIEKINKEVRSRLDRIERPVTDEDTLYHSYVGISHGAFKAQVFDLVVDIDELAHKEIYGLKSQIQTSSASALMLMSRKHTGRKEKESFDYEYSSEQILKKSTFTPKYEADSKARASSTTEIDFDFLEDHLQSGYLTAKSIKDSLSRNSALYRIGLSVIQIVQKNIHEKNYPELEFINVIIEEISSVSLKDLLLDKLCQIYISKNDLDIAREKAVKISNYEMRVSYLKKIDQKDKDKAIISEILASLNDPLHRQYAIDSIELLSDPHPLIDEILDSSFRDNNLELTLAVALKLTHTIPPRGTDKQIWMAKIYDRAIETEKYSLAINAARHFNGKDKVRDFKLLVEGFLRDISRGFDKSKEKFEETSLFFLIQAINTKILKKEYLHLALLYAKKHDPKGYLQEVFSKIINEIDKK